MEPYFISCFTHIIGSVWQVQNIQVVLAEEGKALLSFYNRHGADENEWLTTLTRALEELGL